MSPHQLSSVSVPGKPDRLALGEWEGLKVGAEWALVDGRAEPVRVVVYTDPPRAITAEAVRRLPLGTVLGAMRRDLAWEAPGIEGEHGRVREAAGTGPRRGRALLADDLREVADVYRHAWFEGRHVTQAVADHFRIAPSTAAKRIGAARNAGLLKGVGVKR